VPLSYLDPKHRKSTEEVTAEATQEPNCVEASISSNGQHVIIRVEREFEAEMIAETKVCVLVCDGSCDDFDDKAIDFGEQVSEDYEDLEDDLLDEEIL
jgi:spore coat protein E